MVVDTLLHNAKVLIEGRLIEAGIAVDESRIVRIAKEPNLPLASKKIDLKRCVALPGLIDAHVHLRGQLQSDEEDFFTGTAAAIAGGITSVLDMPNNQPVTQDSTSLKERMKAAQPDIVANVGFFSAFPESLEDISRVVEEGAIGFKLYLTKQIGGLDIDDDEALLHAFNEVRQLGVPVAVHAEDRKMIEALSEDQQEPGYKGVETYLRAHAPEVEAEAVERILRIARRSGLHIHFCHISSEEAVGLIHSARETGLRVSCEVTPHHLMLTSEDLRRQGTIMLTDPPVRSERIVKRLWTAIKGNEVEILASDHAPHLMREKTADSIWDVKPGIPGLETLLPLFLTKVNENQLSIAELARLLAEEPARIFHLRNEGFLREGCNANITVVDMHKKGKIKAEMFHSKAKYSPFDGWRVKGLPSKTFVNGLLAMEDGYLVANRGIGKITRCGDEGHDTA